MTTATRPTGWRSWTRELADRLLELGEQMTRGNFLDEQETRRFWQYTMEEAVRRAEDRIITAAPAMKEERLREAPHARNSGRWLLDEATSAERRGKMKGGTGETRGKRYPIRVRVETKHRTEAGATWKCVGEDMKQWVTGVQHAALKRGEYVFRENGEWTVRMKVER
jgi:hypothetical protein